ncbi:MAG: glycosyltransferase family 4 protein [Planctomycetota bacterium]|jgi:glycosyltransferase involved in cell wall biosynthesis
MRVAMLAPISWPLPPTGYGPWEQVAHNLTENLVALGHDVTLFAAGGSSTSAKLVATTPYSLETWPTDERNRPRAFDHATGLLEGPPDARVLEQAHIARCMEQAAAGDFDVVHSHLHVHALCFAEMIACPMISTLHGAAWVRATHDVFRRYRRHPFVSLSDAERSFLPELNYVATVHNGIEVEQFPFEREKEDYLLFAGRLSPEKGPDKAIKVARAAGRRLLLAGMVEGQHQDFFDTEVKPYVDGHNVEYLGLLSQAELAPVYRKAACVLFLINWCEPFGLVAVEAQASGTPLIATRVGALPEIIQEGKTGFVVDSLEEAVEAVERIDGLKPEDCRENAVTRFSAKAMAQGYSEVYGAAMNSFEPGERHSARRT